jgi:hypothetical protein
VAAEKLSQRLIVGLLSCRRYPQRRQNCRQSWIGNPQQHPDMLVVFLVGESSGLNRQAVQIDDLLLLKCHDGYAQLPQKTLGFCRWALDHANFEYLFKADDDTYLDLDRLAAYDPAGADYIGHDIGGYASGGAGYWLSRRAVEILVKAGLPNTGAEDVLVGKAMAAAGISLRHEARVQPWVNLKMTPTPHNDLISTHAVRGEKMETIHRQMQTAPSASTAKAARNWDTLRILMAPADSRIPLADAAAHCLDRFWSGHPPLHVLRDRNPANWVRSVLRHLRGLAQDQPLLLMLEDHLLCGPPQEELIELACDFLQDPAVACVYLSTPSRPNLQPYPGYDQVGVLPRWQGSFSLQPAIWQTGHLLERLAAVPADVPLPRIEPVLSEICNRQFLDRQHHLAFTPQMGGPDPSQWPLPYYDLVRNGGRPQSQYAAFLESVGLSELR